MLLEMWTKLIQCIASKRGFTLIELLIVISIISILAALSIPQFMGVRGDANLAGVKSELNSIQNAMELYFTENNQYPNGGATLQALVDDNRISKTGIIDSEEVEYGTSSSGTQTLNANSYHIIHDVAGTSQSANPSKKIQVGIDQTGVLIVTD